MRKLAAILAATLALPPCAAPAQKVSVPSEEQVRSPILTIVSDRLFAETRFGQRMQSELRARADALAAENESLQAELSAEEQSLTKRRPTMEVEAFRAEADAFDARVQRIRNEQDAKQEALKQAVEDSRDAFINAVRPVLAELMIESGAGLILEQRQVVLSATLIDVTDEAIAAIDAQLGDGSALDASEAAGDASPPSPEPSGAEDPGAPANPDRSGTVPPAGDGNGD